MSDPSAILALSKHFATLEDPRVERTKLHPLLAINTIAMCAVICGAESWDDIAEFGEATAEWLTSFLDLPNGIPSHDTFNRVFAAPRSEAIPGVFRRNVRCKNSSRSLP